jgi:hypothetical protein
MGSGYNQQYPASPWFQGSMHPDQHGSSNIGSFRGLSELGIWSELITDLTADDRQIWDNIPAQPYNWDHDHLRVLFYAGGAGPMWTGTATANPLGQNIGTTSTGQFSWHNGNPFHYHYSLKLGDSNVSPEVPDSGLGDNSGDNGAYWFLPVGIRVLWFYATR